MLTHLLSLLQALIIIFCCLYCKIAVTLPNTQLPDLGHISQATLTAKQEDDIAIYWRQQMYQHNLLAQDLLLHNYLNKLGKSLIRNNHQSKKFNFYWINQNELNAFAFLGGQICMYYGAMNKIATEGELAAILAHEIAHVLQHHIINTIDLNKKLTPLTIAETLVAMATGNPGLALAAIAVQDQMLINFTRVQEQEADHIGLQLLTSAGFNSQSMLDLFDYFVKEEQFLGKTPEYLRTHPLGVIRISEVKNRLRRYPYKQVNNSLPFYIAKARIEVLSTNDLTQLITKLEKQQQDSSYLHPIYIDYALAFAYLKNSNYLKSSNKINKLITAYADIVEIRALQIELLILQNAINKAEKLIADIYTENPNNHYIIMLYAKCLVLNKRSTKALELLKEHKMLLQEYPKYFDLYQQAASLENNKSLVHYAKAKKLILEGKLFEAIEQFNLAGKIQYKKELENLKKLIITQKNL